MLPRPALHLIGYDDPAARRRRRVRTLLVLALLMLTALKVAQTRLGDRAWTVVLARFWESRCLAHQLPLDRVAFVAAPRGTALPSYLGDFSSTPGSVWNGTVGAVPYPVELVELHKYASKRAARSRADWEHAPGPVFLHGLRDASGREWMITVHALANNPNGFWTLITSARDVDAPDPDAPAAHVVSTAAWPMDNTLADTLVVFAGQPDPNDPSTFTLRAVINQREVRITGIVGTDGKLTFTSSDGLRPWDVKKAGGLVLPAINPSPAPDEPKLLLPTDD